MTKVKDILDHFNIKFEKYDKVVRYDFGSNKPITKPEIRMSISTFYGTDKKMLNNMENEVIEYSFNGPYGYFMFMNKRGKMEMFVINLTNLPGYSIRQLFPVCEYDWKTYRGKFIEYTKIESSGLNPKVEAYLVSKKV